LHIAFLENCAATIFLALTNRGITTFKVEVADDDRGAFPGEANRSGEADSACGAGDDRDFLIQSAYENSLR